MVEPLLALPMGKRVWAEPCLLLALLAAHRVDQRLPAPPLWCVRDPLRVAADSASLRHLGWEKHPPALTPQE